MGREHVVFPIMAACTRGPLTIRGSIRYSTGCFSRVVDLVASGKVDVTKLIASLVSDSAAPKTSLRWSGGGGEDVLKVMVGGVPGGGLPGQVTMDEYLLRLVGERYPEVRAVVLGIGPFASCWTL